MFNKIILIFICLSLLISCGRKNEPKYEALLNIGKVPSDPYNILEMPKKNEIYQ